MFKLMTDNEMNAIIESIPNMNLKTLEAFYDILMQEPLRRADREQREKIYETFSRWYRIKCKLAGVNPKEEYLDEDKWMNPGEPYYVSQEEEHFIEVYLDAISDLNTLIEYYKFVTENVYPRATPKEIERIGSLFAKRESQLRRHEELRRKMEEAMSSEEYKNRPDIGTRVRLKGENLEGVVINRAYTTPEVQVKWDTGEISWIEPKHLEVIS